MPAKLPPEKVRVPVCLRLPQQLLQRLRRACKASDAPSQSDVAIEGIEYVLARFEKKMAKR